MNDRPALAPLDLRGIAGPVGHLLPATADPKSTAGDPDTADVVRGILDQVRAGGDAAVRALTRQFDGADIDDLRVADREIKAALEAIPTGLRTALEVAHDRIVAYHRTQLTQPSDAGAGPGPNPDVRYERDGITVRELAVPVDRAGLYVPGGRAPLASTVLMTAAPARVAGVSEVAMCSPPGPDGTVAGAILAAAAIAGVDEVYRIGGAQAVAALAYGTETVKPVDVIVGPGNRFVAVAERLVAGEGAVGVPSAFTGPSEVVVVADATTPPILAAVDLVVQAEHGPDGLAYLITWDEQAAAAIDQEVARITRESPRRDEILATLERGGYSVLVEGPEQAMAVANDIAPEHLELLTSEAESLVPMVRRAGAVFVGPWAPASLGDYAAGPNHVLPTARSARFGSALRVDDFRKHIHVVGADRGGLERLAPHVVALAESEGLAAHADSIRLRLGRQP